VRIDQRSYDYQPAERELHNLRKQVSLIPELVDALRFALPVIKDEEENHPAPEWSAIRRRFVEILTKLEGGAK